MKSRRVDSIFVEYRCREILDDRIKIKGVQIEHYLHSLLGCLCGVALLKSIKNHVIFNHKKIFQ